MDTTAYISTAMSRFSGSWQLRQLPMPDWILVGTSLFIILNALLVWIGWWTQTRIFVQAFADDAPTHFNTALGFALLGLAFFSGIQAAAPTPTKSLRLPGRHRCRAARTGQIGCGRPGDQRH